MHAVYSYVLILSGAVLLPASWCAPPLYRRQAMTLLVARLPLLSNAVYLVMPRTIIPIDVTPISFACHGSRHRHG